MCDIAAVPVRLVPPPLMNLTSYLIDESSTPLVVCVEVIEPILDTTISLTLSTAPGTAMSEFPLEDLFSASVTFTIL